MTSGSGSKRIGIIGAGAMGGAFGLELAEAGNDVLLVDPWIENVEAINALGMTLVDGEQRKNLQMKAVSSVEGEDPVDLFVVFVKSYETSSATAAAASLIGAETIAVSLQNGWGNGDQLLEFVSPERVTVGVTYVSAALSAPGEVLRTANGETVIGPFEGNDLSPSEEVASAFEGSGLAIRVEPEIRQKIWAKLVLNASANPTAALTGLTSGELASCQPVWRLVRGLAREVIQVACAQGYNLSEEDTLVEIEKALAFAGPTRASMLQDFTANRRSEIDVITGAVLRAAEAHGVEVPLNELMMSLVLGSEEARGIA